MKSNYQKLTMMTCLLASSLCFNVFAQDATETQPLSPEDEMAIMKVMNLAAGPSIKAAFASVQRDGKPYKTFYNNYIAPHAVLEKDIVFTAHQDGQGCPIIDAYDIKKKTWNGPVRASSTGLGADTHGNPSITIDSKGHLHVFFGCHGKAMKHVRSAAPYDISRVGKDAQPDSARHVSAIDAHGRWQHLPFLSCRRTQGALVDAHQQRRWTVLDQAGARH